MKVGRKRRKARALESRRAKRKSWSGDLNKLREVWDRVGKHRVTCPNCKKKLGVSSILAYDAKDGLGDTWEEWYCGHCDTPFEQNRRSI